jgi:hypothetical protein
MRAGAKSCVRTPLLGDAFLISAMMAGGPAARAARKSRRAVRRSSAARSQASSGSTCCSMSDECEKGRAIGKSNNGMI